MNDVDRKRFYNLLEPAKPLASGDDQYVDVDGYGDVDSRIRGTSFRYWMLRNFQLAYGLVSAST